MSTATAKPENGDKMTAKDVVIERSLTTKQIIVPQSMPLKEAIVWLKRKDEDEDKEVAVLHEIDCFPLDGAVAFADALAERFGFTQKVDIPPTFWKDAEPPLMVGVPTGRDTFRQVPWGRVAIPGVVGFLATGLNANPTPKFLITGKIKQRHLPEVAEIVEATKKRLVTDSIYKGKAIELDLSWLRPTSKTAFDPLGHAPRFTIPLEGATEESLILPEKVMRDVNDGLFTAIDHSEFCQRMGVPVRRGVLLSGDYGTGKTLMAWITAAKAVRAGMTFIYLKSVLDLAQGFAFARQYQPAVVFAEDIDRIISDPQSEQMEQLRNAFDGVNTKTSKVVTVLTTNHLDKIDPALLRPGRCDVLVKVERPDADAAVRLVKLYGRGLLSESVDYSQIGEALDGHLPAEIREAVERSKMACIARLARQSHGKIDGSTGTVKGLIDTGDIMQAVRAMDMQHALLLPRVADKRSDLEKCADILGARMSDAAKQSAMMVLKAAIAGGADEESLAEMAGELVDG